MNSVWNIEESYLCPERSDCWNKKQFKSKEAALFAVERYKTRYGCKYIRVYKCPYCQKYHLTSKQKTIKGDK